MKKSPQFAEIFHFLLCRVLLRFSRFLPKKQPMVDEIIVNKYIVGLKLSFSPTMKYNNTNMHTINVPNIMPLNRYFSFIRLASANAAMKVLTSETTLAVNPMYARGSFVLFKINVANRVNIAVIIA